MVKIKSSMHAPWSNRDIERLARRKRSKWDKYRRSRDINDYEVYKNGLKNFNEAKATAIIDYENRIIASKNTDAKKYYKYVSFKNKYKNQKITMKNGDEMESNDVACANILNKYFRLRIY